jgi:hypothetical protein
MSIHFFSLSSRALMATISVLADMNTALVGGDDARARDWLHAPNEHLGGVPVDRLADVQGLVDVVEYLDAVRGRL